MMLTGLKKPKYMLNLGLNKVQNYPTMACFSEDFFFNPWASYSITMRLQGYSYDQRLENVDIDFNVPHAPIVGLGQ